ncbi:MAG: ABC-F family ATP-binding cassette domain-containing protein [Acidimicrobiales bacterium]
MLTEVDVSVGPTRRLGVIGPNGVGKTTLLQILAGLEAADSGTLTLAPPSATVGYLAQEQQTRSGETLREALGRRTGVSAAEAALATTAAALTTEAAGAADSYETALERYLALGAADFEARASTVLHDLGLPTRLLDVSTEGLSGGQRAKAALAALLLSRFDLLLLDEPTNDLDFDGLERLEGFLGARSGGLVVVSHDRAFLERIVTDVLEIDELTHRALLYAGGFAAYLEARATARRHAVQNYEAFVSERDRLGRREREQRQWSVVGSAKEKRSPRDNDKAQRDFRLNRTEKQASKVRITEKAIERLDVIEKPFEPWQLHLDLAAAGRSGEVVARLESAVVERGSWRLGPIDLEINWADRIGVLGPNGSGKSTLISAILGQVPLDGGRRFVGPGVVVGGLGQERGRFSGGDDNLIGEFLQATNLQLSEARSLLAKFGLSAAHVGRPAASLSPGERTRAELALLMARGTNCLVLDEPTNHLDLAAIEQLEEALGAWEGTLVLVTHDRRLLDSVRLTRQIRLVDGMASTVEL